MLYPFNALLARMKYITRWSLMHSTRAESLSEHTCDTALLAHTLCLIARQYTGTPCRPKTVAVAALYHDASEILTGDMPTPIKYDNPDIQGAYKAVEAVAEQKLLAMLPEDLRPVYGEALTMPDPHVRALVKAADKLSAYLKCVEERKAGNMEFRSAEEQIHAALRENPLPSLAYFMEHFLPGFQLTLDELQRSGEELSGQTKLNLTSGKDGEPL